MHVSASGTFLVARGQKGINSLELELETIMSHCVGAENQTQGLTHTLSQMMYLKI